MTTHTKHSGGAAEPGFDSLVLYCRPGFEGDCAAEIVDRAASLGIGGYCRAPRDSGWLRFIPQGEAAAARLLRGIDFRTLIFPRQWFARLTGLDALPESDRASPIARAVAGKVNSLYELHIDYPDTNEGKALSRFARRFEAPLRRALEGTGVRIGAAASAPRLHCFFAASAAAVDIGLSDPANSAPWPRGVPRLRMPAAAPSRSTLKLEEAFGVLLTPQQREEAFRAGQWAVDLGAAPGGWTWQLVQRGLRVVAVDNGTIDPELIGSGQVEHRRSDAFTFRPRGHVDWVVCDIVDKPKRVAELMARWLARGDARRAVFNLKLPMRQRYATVNECLALIGEALAKANLGYQLACKQLYHDREEVTVFAAVQ